VPSTTRERYPAAADAAIRSRRMVSFRELLVRPL